MNQSKRPTVLMIVSMTVFGTLGPFVRNIALSSGALALCRAVLAAAFLGLFLLVTRQRIPFREIKRELLLLLASGMVLGMDWVLLFQAYRYTTVSMATLSCYFAPVLITALCPIIFKERPTRRQLFCFTMSTLGLVLVIGVSGAGGGTDLIGVLFGLGSAVFYAAVVILNKFIRSVDGIQRTFLQFVSALVVLVPYVACTGGVGLGALDGKGWVSLLIVGLFHTGVTYGLYFSSLRDLSGQEAAILSYIDPLLAVVISVAVLNESITPLQIVGGVMILGFTLWNELGQMKKEA